MSKGRIGNRLCFECSEFQRYGKSRCSVHYISYDNLYNFVLAALQNVVSFASSDKGRFYESVSKRSRSAQNKEIKVIESELKRAEKKLEETEKLIIKLFE
ncbi:MAG: recombinase zinc beta ribbon domain-containing protein, partial [Clostridia bacterium]|nr:recombinase zinc beta ribbon domain-containing protein [Clostridia bacterium]